MFILQYRHTYRQKDILLLYIRVLQGSIPPNVSLIGSAINEGLCNKNTHIIQYVIKIQKSLFFRKNGSQKLFLHTFCLLEKYLLEMIFFRKNGSQKLFHSTFCLLEKYILEIIFFRKNGSQKIFHHTFCLLEKYFLET